MNTTAKGDLFEKQVFKLIRDLLNNEEYYLSGKNSKIFAKKAYYSKTRESNIIFDITIESYMKGAEEYSMLNVIECKNLNKNVTVDDIEEFDSKLEQVGKHNTKGTLVSSVGFASGTKKIAKNLKIALLRVKKNNELEWINYRKNKVKFSINIEEENIKEPFVGFVNNRVVNNMADFLLEKKIIDFYFHKDRYIRVPFKSKESIEKIVERLYEYDIHDDFVINIDKLCSFISAYYPVSFDLSKPLNGLLGKIEFDPLKISVNSELDENRFRFTLCHEIGHLILHNKLLADKIDKREDIDTSLSLEFYSSEINTVRMEIQANMFANSLLIPLHVFRKEVKQYFKDERITKNQLYLDNQPINRLLVFNLIEKLNTKFKVSKEAVKIKLVTEGFLEDATDYSIKKMLKNIKNEFQLS